MKFLCEFAIQKVLWSLCLIFNRTEIDKMILVVGAGIAGIAASLALAQAGWKVVLVEKTERIGGTLTQSLIHTLAGFYDQQGIEVNPGISGVFLKRLFSADLQASKEKIGRLYVLRLNPETVEKVLKELVLQTQGIELHLGTVVRRIIRRKGEICGVETGNCSQTLTSFYRPYFLIDATGTAAVVSMIDPCFIKDHSADVAAGSIFRLNHVDPQFSQFPSTVAVARAIQQKVRAGLLSEELFNTFLDKGVKPDEVYVKLWLKACHSKCHKDEYEQKARILQAELVAFLHTLPGYTEAKVTASGKVGFRLQAQIKGDYCLLVEDVKKGRKFPDALCCGCWPIEHWHVKKGLYLEYLPEKVYYHIPYGAVKVAGLDNVYAVGKCLSADYLAQSSARVAGSCWAMAEGLGKKLVEKLQRG